MLRKFAFGFGYYNIHKKVIDYTLFYFEVILNKDGIYERRVKSVFKNVIIQ